MNDPIHVLANVIFGLNAVELERLRLLLNEGQGGSGDPAGVGAVIPPNLPLKEGGAEANFEDWPDEYWESQA